jgi:hypothetical protein
MISSSSLVLFLLFASTNCEAFAIASTAIDYERTSVTFSDEDLLEDFDTFGRIMILTKDGGTRLCFFDFSGLYARGMLAFTTTFVAVSTTLLPSIPTNLSLSTTT